MKQFSLQRKCRLVCDGSKVDASDVPTYASVVSRESVRIAFTIAALNGLSVLAADCEGAYLNAKPREKMHTKCGPEFGSMHCGRWAIIVRALYGAPGSAASWRFCINKVIEGMGLKMCRADNDVWFRPAQNAEGMDVFMSIFSCILMICL